MNADQVIGVAPPLQVRRVVVFSLGVSLLLCVVCLLKKMEKIGPDHRLIFGADAFLTLQQGW